MVVVPVVPPVTVPVEEPIAATDGLLLVHVPPATLSVKVVARPAQTGGEVMTDGNGLTVTMVEGWAMPHVDKNTESLINTVPADTPVTMPDEEPTVAMAILLLLHTPPPVA